MTDSSSDGRGNEQRGRPTTIGRQLAIGFALVALISVSMCGMLLVALDDVGTIIERMRSYETSIRGGLSVSTGVREQYIHIAHSLIEGDRSHLPHYSDWVDQLRSDTESLARGESSEVAARLDEVTARSIEMDQVFQSRLLPAAERGELAMARSEHRRVEALSADAAIHADWVASDAERRMTSAHDEARAAVRMGFAMGGSCVLAVLLVAIVYTIRLRAAVLRPLGALGRAADRFGRGDFGHRVDSSGPGELGEVGRAFNRMAEELADRERRLLRGERMAAIGQLAAGIAHEVNNPIGIIRGYLKTMLPDASGETRGELEILDEEAATCQRLTQDLITFATEPELARCRVDMRTFLVEAGERLAELPEIERHSLDIEAASAPLEVDALRLRQVLANLVRNAAHASDGGTSIIIRGAPRVDGGYLIEIDDEGPGIEPEERQRIFEPFYSGRGGGSGLGLAVCQSIITAHGGSIEVGSGSRGGATFLVELPEVKEDH